VLETALNEEMTEHVGREKKRVLEGDPTNVCDGTGLKKVLTYSTGKAEPEVPRGCEPVIAKKRQRRVDEVVEIVASQSAGGLAAYPVLCRSSGCPGPSSPVGWRVLCLA